MTEPTEQEVLALIVRGRIARYNAANGPFIGELVDMLESLSSRLAAERKENGNLRAALRVNGYRAGFTDEQIDKALAAIAESTK